MFEQFKLDLDDRPKTAKVNVGYLLLGGLNNAFKDEGFESARKALINHLLEQETIGALRKHSNLRGYRELHRQFAGVDSALVPSPESLFEALFKHGGLRPINPIVDIYNSIALRHRLSCGAHDIDTLAGAINLRLCQDGDSFHALGHKKAKPLPNGEYAYFDGNGRAICRLECRQAAHSVVAAKTTNVAFIVQGNAAVSTAQIEDALEDLEALIVKHIGVASSRLQQIYQTEAIAA